LFIDERLISTHYPRLSLKLLNFYRANRIELYRTNDDAEQYLKKLLTKIWRATSLQP